MNKQIEDFVKTDKDLNKLLNEKKISIFSDFSNKVYQENDLKEFISKSYESVFNQMYFNDNTLNTSEKIMLIKSLKYLGTDEFKETILEDFLKLITITYDDTKKFRNVIEKIINNEPNFYKIEDYENLMDESIFNPISMEIFNSFDDYKNIYEIKNNWMSENMVMCDLVADKNPKKESIYYAIYNVIINNLKNVKNYESNLKERFDFHFKKINVKRDSIDNQYYVYIFLIIIFILFKFLRLLSN